MEEITGHEIRNYFINEFIKIDKLINLFSESNNSTYYILKSIKNRYAKVITEIDCSKKFECSTELKNNYKTYHVKFYNENFIKELNQQAEEHVKEYVVNTDYELMTRLEKTLVNSLILTNSMLEKDEYNNDGKIVTIIKSE